MDFLEQAIMFCLVELISLTLIMKPVPMRGRLKKELANFLPVRTLFSFSQEKCYGIKGYVLMLMANDAAKCDVDLKYFHPAEKTSKEP